MKIEGACHCGTITYEAVVDPDKVAICHCTDCQTLSGSAFRTVVPAPKETFTLRTGQPKIYVKTAESGTKRAQLPPKSQVWCRSALDWVMDLGSVAQESRAPQGKPIK